MRLSQALPHSLCCVLLFLLTERTVLLSHDRFWITLPNSADLGWSYLAASGIGSDSVFGRFELFVCIGALSARVYRIYDCLGPHSCYNSELPINSKLILVFTFLTLLDWPCLWLHPHMWSGGLCSPGFAMYRMPWLTDILFIGRFYLEVKPVAFAMDSGLNLCRSRWTFSKLIFLVNRYVLSGLILCVHILRIGVREEHLP